MDQRKPNRKGERVQTAMQAFYQYAAEHEGTELDVAIGDKIWSKVDAGPILPIVLGPPPEEPRPIGYFVTVHGPSGQWYKREFDVDGTLTCETFGEGAG